MGSKIAGWLTNYSRNSSSFGKKYRRKRIQTFLDMIKDVYESKGHVSILDIGGTSTYWDLVDDSFLHDFNVKITLLNLPSRESFQDTSHIVHRFGDATEALWETYMQSDFDLIHSNSVIEHVGDWKKMKQFALNITSFRGGYFVQTPNFWFPVEPHCLTLLFHWLPKPIRIFWVQKMALGHWPKASDVSEAVDIVESARLLDKYQFKFLFNDAELIREQILIFTKSFIAVKRI